MSGMPWRGLLAAGGILLVALMQLVGGPTMPPGAVAPGVLTDAYGRIEWARLFAMSGAVSAAGAAVAYVLAPFFERRAREIRLRDKAAWSEDVLAGLAHNPATARATIGALFPDEAKRRDEAHALALRATANYEAMSEALSEARIIQAVPRIEENVQRLTEAMTSLTTELRTVREERTRERVADREEFGRLSEQVRQIHSAAYDGPDRRLLERRGPSSGGAS